MRSMYLKGLSVLLCSVAMNTMAAELTDVEIGEIEKKIHYQFTNKSLLRSAFTHKSFTNEANRIQTEFEPLEFLGDATLKTAVASRIYDASKSEGFLSKRCESKIENAALASTFRYLKLEPYVKANSETLRTGANTVYSDATEALIGAIQRDAKSPDDGFRNALRFVDAHIMPDRPAEAVTSQTPVQQRVVVPQSAQQAQSQSGDSTKEPKPKSKKEVTALRSKAEEGDKAAQLELAQHYITKESYQEAFKWLRQCNNAGSWFEIAELYKDGHRDPSDRFGLVLYEQYYKKAAEQEHPGANYELGLIYKDKWDKGDRVAYGGKNNIQKAIEVFCKAAAGKCAAKEELANLYRRTLLSQSDGQALVALDDISKYYLYKEAADAGIIDAQRKLADLLLSKKVGLQNGRGEQVGFSYLIRAAEQGDPADQIKVVECYEVGKGVEQSYSKSLDWLKRAADGGHAEAQYKVGLSYEFGKGVEKDIDKAKEWYQKSFSKGNASAGYRLDELTVQVVQDPRLFRAFAEQGNADAQNNMGLWFLGKDDEEAFFWFEKSANQNSAVGQYNLARLYRFGRGCDRDESKSIELYKKAAAQRHAKSQYELAEVYEFGVERSRVKAKKNEYRFDIAIKDESRNSWNYQDSLNPDVKRKINDYSSKIRDLCQSRYSSPSYNDREALPLYQGLALKDDASSQCRLGVWHFLGKGSLTRSEAEAVKWWTRAAALENTEAKTYLGVMYAKGQGVPKNELRAMELFQSAANEGDTYAMYNLALLFVEGKGVPKNDKEALALLTHAIDLVH